MPSLMQTDWSDVNDSESWDATMSELPADQLWSWGQPIDEAYLPIRVTFTRLDNPLMDFGTLFRSSQFAVTESFRKVVEALEPGVHQFAPIEATGPDGGPLPEPIYMLKVLTVLPGIDNERSGLKLRKMPPPMQGIMKGDVTGEDRFRYNFAYPTWYRDDVVANHHLWVDDRTLISDHFVSDELRAAIEAAGLKGMMFEAGQTD